MRLTKAEIDVFEIADNTYVVQGAMSLNDFNEYFDVELQSDDVDTIAGYYLTEVGRIPTLKERLSCEVDSQKKHSHFDKRQSKKWSCDQGES